MEVSASITHQQLAAFTDPCSFTRCASSLSGSQASGYRSSADAPSSTPRSSMASTQAPVGPLCWQAIAVVAKSHMPSLPISRTRPLLASTSCSLASPVAGPSTSFATSQRFVRGKSSAARPAFKVGDMYSSDPILGGRAKLLNDWNAKHEVDTTLFEDDVADEYAALRLTSDDDRRDDDRRLPRAASAPTITSSGPLVQAVQDGRWADARAEFQQLHSAGRTVPFDSVYLHAALESLTSTEIETAEDRLEWFILWASLLPADRVQVPYTPLPEAVVRQHQQVVEQLLCYPTHLGHLARALMLFCEKGLGEVYRRRMSHHIVAFSPPGTAFPLVDSICQNAGWARDSFERSKSFNDVIHGLMKSRSFDDAVSTIRQARATSEPFFRKGYLWPTIGLKTYQYLLEQIERRCGIHSPLLPQLRALAVEDHPDECAFGIPPLKDRKQVQLHTDGRPGFEHLPRAIFLISRSTTRQSAVALSNVLEALYMTPAPRPRLVALLYRRLTSPRGNNPRESVLSEVGQRLWISAEMMRLIRVGRPADALSLFAARCQWIALPTSEVWDAFRNNRPELSPEQATLIAEGRPPPINDPTRKLIAGSKLTAIAYSAIVAMHGENVELMLQDYREFLTFTDPVPRQPMPSPVAAVVDMSAADQESNLFEDLPAAAAPEAGPVFTPWSGPHLEHVVKDSERAGSNAWVGWLTAFARFDTKLAAAVLRDMRLRNVPHDCRIYGHLFVSMVQANELDEARAGLADLVRQGGISFEDVRAAVTSENEGRRPRVTAEGLDDQFPPVTAWLYVRLIRKFALSQRPALSVELEDEMRSLGFPLSSDEKTLMDETYDIRHGRRVREARRRGTPLPTRILSPWGTPGVATSPDVIYIPGERTGAQGFSYAQQEPARFQGNTLQEEAYPLRARMLEMAAGTFRQQEQATERAMRKERRRKTTRAMRGNETTPLGDT
jgi:hypothetical protein